jgi:hypothetical protein
MGIGPVVRKNVMAEAHSRKAKEAKRRGNVKSKYYRDWVRYRKFGYIYLPVSTFFS